MDRKLGKDLIIRENFIKSKAFIWFTLFVFLNPESINYYGMLKKCVMFGLIISIGLIIILYIKVVRNISMCIMLVFAYQLMLLISTLLHGGTTSGFRRLIAIVFFCMFVQLEIKVNCNRFIKDTSQFLFVLIFLNFISMFFKFIPDIYFLGLRVNFVHCTIAAFSLNLLCHYVLNERFSWKDIMLCIFAIAPIVYEWVGTALLAIVVFILAFFIGRFVYRRRTIRKHIFPVLIILLGIVTNYLVVIVRVQNKFDWLIEDILHKSLTMSGRTFIWDSAIPIIKESLWFGHGVDTQLIHVYWADLYYAHSQLMQLLIEGGIIGTFLFSLLMIIVAFKLKQCDELIAIPLIAGIAANLCIMMSEVPGNYLYIFLLLFISANIKKISEARIIL